MAAVGSITSSNPPFRDFSLAGEDGKWLGTNADIHQLLKENWYFGSFGGVGKEHVSMLLNTTVHRLAF